MLVLTRKINQQIRLGDNITVTILRVQGNSIRIGVEAPKDVRVVRGELSPLSQPEAAYRSEDSAATGAASLPMPESVSSSSLASESESESMPMPGSPMMLEFDLDDLDAETLQALEASANHSPERAKVYQMRTSAPLARFFPPQAREAVGHYSVS